MKEITCYDIDAIKDSQFHTILQQAIEKYRKSNHLPAGIALVFLLPLIIGSGIFGMVFFLASDIMLQGLKESLSKSLAPLVSEAIVSVIDLVVYSIVETVLISPAIIFIVIFGAMLYQSIKRATDKYPNVAKVLYLVENPEEAWIITTSGFLHAKIIGMLMNSLNRIGIDTNKLLANAYAKGAVISKTSCEAMPFTTIKGRGLNVNVKAVLTKIDVYTLLVVLQEAPGAIYGSRFLISVALLKSTDREQLIDKMRKTGGVEIIETSIEGVKKILQ